MGLVAGGTRLLSNGLVTSQQCPLASLSLHKSFHLILQLRILPFTGVGSDKNQALELLPSQG